MLSFLYFRTLSPRTDDVSELKRVREWEETTDTTRWTIHWHDCLCWQQLDWNLIFHSFSFLPHLYTHPSTYSTPRRIIAMFPLATIRRRWTIDVDDDAACVRVESRIHRYLLNTSIRSDFAFNFGCNDGALGEGSHSTKTREFHARKHESNTKLGKTRTRLVEFTNSQTFSKKTELRRAPRLKCPKMGRKDSFFFIARDFTSTIHRIPRNKKERAFL